MKKIMDFDTQEDFLLFAKIIEKIADSNIVGTIKQVTKNGDSYVFVDIQQQVVDTKTTISISGDYLYITAENFSKADVIKLKTLWETTLRRSTLCFKEGKESDYLFQIDVIKDEDGNVYSLTGVQPIFASGNDDKNLTFVFDINDVRCSIDKITLQDIEYEQALRDIKRDTNEVYKEDSSFNEDILNNNQYIKNI